MSILHSSRQVSYKAGAFRLVAVVVASFLVSTRAAPGQSSFGFDNYIPGVIDAPVFNWDGSRLFGTNYVALLYGGPTVDSLVPALSSAYEVLQPVAFTYTAEGQAGYFHARSYVIVVNVTPPGGFTWLQVRAWDLNLGATYEDVTALGLGGFGESPAWYQQGGNPAGPITPARSLYGLESFSLRPVPEPSAWALLVLSGLSVWWGVCRRRPSG